MTPTVKPRKNVCRKRLRTGGCVFGVNLQIPAAELVAIIGMSSTLPIRHAFTGAYDSLLSGIQRTGSRAEPIRGNVS